MRDAQAPVSDETWMQLYLSGDVDAFEELYRRLAPRVFAYLLRHLGSREEAEEVHQAVFAKFHRKRHQYRAEYAVAQWVFVIAKTALLDHRRAAARWRAEELTNEFPAETQGPNPWPNHDEADRLGILAEEQRQIVKWKVLDEASYEEIAKRLGKTEVSVRQTLSRALKKLRLAAGGE